MTKLFANAKLVKGYRIDVDDGRAHAICLDMTRDMGTDMGPSALELYLMSHAGCYATIFVMTANKMRIALKDMEVKVEAVKSEEAGTITEEKFAITIKTSAPKDRVQHAHKLTLKSCPVGKLIEKAGVKLSYSIKTLKE